MILPIFTNKFKTFINIYFQDFLFSCREITATFNRNSENTPLFVKKNSPGRLFFGRNYKNVYPVSTIKNHCQRVKIYQTRVVLIHFVMSRKLKDGTNSEANMPIANTITAIPRAISAAAAQNTGCAESPVAGTSL